MKRITFLLCCVLLVGSACSRKEYNTSAAIYGVVIDNETTDPIGGAAVVLAPGGKTKTTGNDGLYEFNDLDPAQYTITVQKTGYQTNRKTITAVSGESTEANISLTKSN
ncbi:hypothetical protein AGMMS4956_10800 [Bacteroidia bacterium]|nr:hypothetical protein AGMMS4956_10800 [Bacteroidia bacterium]